MLQQESTASLETKGWFECHAHYRGIYRWILYYFQHERTQILGIWALTLNARKKLETAFSQEGSKSAVDLGFFIYLGQTMVN